MASKAEISGSFLGRMLFRFVLMCVMWAVSVILLNSYVNLPSSGSQIATKNDSGGYSTVIFGSVGIALSSFSLIILFMVDINGSKSFEPWFYQGQDFCMNDTGRVDTDMSKPAGSSNSPYEHDIGPAGQPPAFNRQGQV
uniref:Uncharacterized protein n=1 Tax=viral metagenome TaxID=1070528 RepID=A0A6C0CN13_9ZZZZ